MNKDQRQDPRITLSMEIMLESIPIKRKARLRNLSMGGCFVDTIARVSQGEVIVFKIALPNGQSGLLSGEVVYASPLIGFSLCFTVITEEEENLLKQVIEAHRKDAISYVY
jgi:hypothetical protein